MTRHRLALLMLFVILPSVLISEQNGTIPRISDEASRPLTERSRDNLIAFANLYGYVRFFYRGERAAATSWDDFALQAIGEVEPAKTPADLADRLTAIFAPIAPDVHVFPTSQEPPKSNDQSSTKRVVIWRHLGLGLTKVGDFSAYSSRRVVISSAEAKALLTPFRAALAGGVSCVVPLALPAGKSLPQLATVVPVTAVTSDARTARLADVVITWNIFRYFYPYFDTVQVDWPAALSDALSSAAGSRNEEEFTRSLRKLVAASRDGHGNVYKIGRPGEYVPPVLWVWADKQIVALNTDGKVDVQPGDRLISIDGRPALEALSEEETLWAGATEQWLRQRALSFLFARLLGAQVQVDVEAYAHPGSVRSVPLNCSTPSYLLTEPRPPKIAELDAGILYVDLSRINDADFAGATDELSRAKAIVFDMRGYPRNIKNPAAILGHLTHSEMKSAQFLVPEVTSPDPKTTVLRGGGDWHISPVSPFFAAKRFFLVDGRVISYAESIMGIVEYYRLGEIVGSPTAGTNGNVDQYVLPGGYRLSWTGMKVLKQDGAVHHGVGIQPTIPISPTRAGIAARKDEILDRAIREAKAPSARSSY